MADSSEALKSAIDTSFKQECSFRPAIQSMILISHSQLKIPECENRKWYEFSLKIKWPHRGRAVGRKDS